MSHARRQRLAAKKRSATRPATLTGVPRHEWPYDDDPRRIAVFCSRDYLVQIFDETTATRLSVQRTGLRADGHWVDQIAWDELQRIKRVVGYGDHYAIEVYPRDRDTVSVANLRHLWVLPEPLPHGWFAP